MTNEIKKKEIRDLIEAILIAAENIVDSNTHPRYSAEQIVADLAIDALEFSIMKEYAVFLEPTKDNVIKLTRKE